MRIWGPGATQGAGLTENAKMAGWNQIFVHIKLRTQLKNSMVFK